MDCMKFLFIGEDKYAVVGGVYQGIKGAEELLDFFELDVPVDEARFVTVAKEDEDGDVMGLTSLPFPQILFTLVMMSLGPLLKSSTTLKPLGDRLPLYSLQIL